MPRILSNHQARQFDRDMQELAAYRSTGLTPEAINNLLFPQDADSPLPMDLWATDPAQKAQGQREEEQWSK